MFRLLGARGYAAAEAVIYRPSPQMQQRGRQPAEKRAAVSSKDEVPRRPPLERREKGWPPWTPTLNQTKAEALRGLTSGASRCAGQVPREKWWRIVWWGFIPTWGQQEGELGVGGRVEGGDGGAWRDVDGAWKGR